MDFAMPVISQVFEIIKRSCDPIVRRVVYIKNLEKNFKRLNERANDLYSRRDDIKKEIDRHGAKVTPTSQCENWLKKVEEIQDHLNSIENEYCSMDNKFLKGWCPDISKRMTLGKRVVRAIDQVGYLNKNSKFEGGLVVDAPTKVVEVIPAPRIEVVTSTSCTLQKVVQCLRNESFQKIGIWGMAGIGKTTMMKVLNNLQEISQMFAVVIWVTVSRDWCIRKVQKEIADRLLLNIGSGESNDRAARKIFQELEGRKFLLLLDDVWEKIELDDVGIPRKDQGKGCKEVLTTRFRQVCNRMETDEEIKVEILFKEEAWKLFHEKVGDVVNLPSIHPFARCVVEECGGLPLAIIAVGGALRKEYNIHVWKNALKELRSPSTTRIEDMEEQVFRRLRFSFDRLKDDTTKSCFLYGALYPEDERISIDELIRYWRTEGLLEGKSAYDQGHAILKDLMDASLIEYDGTDYIKMHDVIRDLALRITSRNGEGCNFLVRAGIGIDDPPKEEEWEHMERISLMHNKLLGLPQSPYSPSLSTLLLQGNETLRIIPESFFNHMKGLRILDLSSTNIESLPRSTCNMVSLQGLYLNDCLRLKSLPSEVGALKTLEVLALGGCTQIDFLPASTRELVHLRCLQVSFSTSMVDDRNLAETKGRMAKIIPDGMTSRLPQLEELRIRVDPNDEQWDEKLTSAITKDLTSLREITCLDFHFPNMECLEQFLRFSRAWKQGQLITINISVAGSCRKRDTQTIRNFLGTDFDGRSRILRVYDCDNISHGTVELLQRANVFKILRHYKLQHLFEFGAENMNGLTDCSILDCEKLESVIDGNELLESALPNLQTLNISQLPNLSTIWKCPMRQGSLSNLRSLTLMCSPKIKKIGSDFVKLLLNLEFLKVFHCPRMEGLIVNEEERTVQHELLPNLKVLHLQRLPDLVSICEGGSLAWSSVTKLDVRRCPNLKNLPLDVYKATSLREIKGSIEWWERLEWENDAVRRQLQPLFLPIQYG